MTESYDRFNDECGVVGVFGVEEASNITYLGLHSLQHRGQEGAGIVSCSDDKFYQFRARGLVGDVFGADEIGSLHGAMAIGHVRYSTTGENALKNVQPLSATYRYGQVAISHNGNIVNAKELRTQLESEGSIFSSTSDTEVILHLLARSSQKTFVNRLVEALSYLQGAYSLLVMTENKLVAVRDPHGFRPLAWGRLGGGHVLASESCALDLVGATVVREINPGEMLIVDKNGATSISPFGRQDTKSCIFEQIYFARPNTVFSGRSVYESRYQFGRTLAKECAVAADVVIPVPDSGTAAALGYAYESGLPFHQGLIRSHYVGRTFIEPSQSIRDFGVKLKLSPIRSVVEGKRVVVIDDSLVRGTTSRKIVRMLRNAGAKEVHVRIAAPPIIASCFYGIDTPEVSELIAHTMSQDEISTYIGSDTLGYLPVVSMHELLGGRSGFCDACFTGDYPVPVADVAATHQLDLFSANIEPDSSD